MCTNTSAASAPVAWKNDSRHWQIGANSAFAVASSLVNARRLRPEATQTTHWVTNPPTPIIMQGEEGGPFD